MPFEKELAVARSVARQSGELAKKLQAQGLKPEEKADLSPVTRADKECEKLISRLLLEVFPDDGLLGEEGAEKEAVNGRKWIIDPIDGTRDFVRGAPLWSVLIGLEVDGVVETGVCYLAPRGEMFFAIRGHGAFCDDTRIGVSNVSSASQAVLCINGLNNMSRRTFAPGLLEWMSRFWAVRSMGGCVDAMMLAAGQADFWIENTAKAWDLAPLKVILEEAGALFRNSNGADSIYGGDCLAFVPALESEALSLMAIGSKESTV
jgi:fructose-1,6-bisphosphatase/inositol monophosphatase family enzyme